VIVETILGWQGLGALTATAIRVRDVPLVMGIVVVTTVAVWLGNAFAEVLQMLNDPRLRYEVAS
jgi:peptide/nickel transport system permease protein